MKKTLSLALIMLLVLAMAFTGCSKKTDTTTETGTDTTAAATGDLTFGTGGDQGTYYAFGGVIAQYVSNNTDLSVTAVTSGGSKSNIEDMSANAVQLGFCQSDVMSYAYNGERLFDAPVNDFSVAAALYMEQVQIVTCNPDIKTPADLAGKSVSVGDQGSGTYFNAMDVLEAYGLTIDDISPVYQSFGDSAESIKDGKIDAAFVVAGAPTTAITDLATAKDVYLVGMDDEHIAALIEKSPYYSAYTIPAGTYTGLDTDTQTVAVAAVVLVRDDVSEDAVYSFVSTIFDNAGSLQHAKAQELSAEFAASMTSVPYHPGAAKYFTEQGFTVATK